MATITDNDKYVLNAIFNPNYPLDFDKKSPSDSTDAETQSKIYFKSYFNSYNYIHFHLCKCYFQSNH